MILDEPTNHMDIIGKETLEKMLKHYTGTLLFVSHDRYFVKQVASSVLVFEDDDVMLYPHGYVSYLERVAKNQAGEKRAATKAKNERKSFTTPAKEKARREARIKKLEALLAECEETIAALQAEISSDEIASDYIRLT